MPQITDKLLQSVIDSQERALRGSNRRLQRSIFQYLQSYKRNVRRYVRGQMGQSRAADISMFEAVRTGQELRQILIDSGLESMIDLHFAELDRLEPTALRYFTKAGITSTQGGISRTAVRAYKSYSDYEIRRVMDVKLVTPVQNMLLATALGEMPRSELINTVANQAVANQIAASRSSIETTINDLHRGYQRHVTNTKADELELEWYIYDGPLDSITSEQCESMLTQAPHGVPGLYRKKDITAALHPKIPRGSNPLINGGHINCRHKFYPITEGEARRRGYGN